MTQSLQARLLNWYDRRGRDLPWRVKGGRQDPYKVWLSEIMLQQTTVAAVKDYFLAFIDRWPSVSHLAAADRDEVLKAWAGLGYYARARNLHACAQRVTRDLGGRFPDNVDDLRGLPGVGAYTAAAIAAIAFDHPCAAVDGNVERVLSRFCAIETPLPQAKPEIRQLAQAIVPRERPGDFAQALMDLGATVCTPKSPACGYCPWAEDCRALKQGMAGVLPRKAEKKKLPTRRGYAYWITHGGTLVLLRQRLDKGLLGGMTEVPGSEWAPQRPASLSADAPVAADWRKLPGLVEHTFTHFHLEITVCVADVAKIDPPPRCRWIALDALSGEGLPTVMRKIAEHAQRTAHPRQRRRQKKPVESR